MFGNMEICEVLEDKAVVEDRFFEDETKKRCTS